MRKLMIAAIAAAAMAAGTAQNASAALTTTQITGPCATQQALFEKYNIQIDMYAPAVSWAYGVICGITDGGGQTPAPCASLWFLMDKYGIELGMHFPLLEDAIRDVCGVTG